MKQEGNTTDLERAVERQLQLLNTGHRIRAATRCCRSQRSGAPINSTFSLWIEKKMLIMQQGDGEAGGVGGLYLDSSDSMRRFYRLPVSQTFCVMPR